MHYRDVCSSLPRSYRSYPAMLSVRVSKEAQSRRSRLRFGRSRLRSVPPKLSAERDYFDYTKSIHGRYEGQRVALPVFVQHQVEIMQIPSRAMLIS